MCFLLFAGVLRARLRAAGPEWLASTAFAGAVVYAVGLGLFGASQIALTDAAVYYENSDMQASLDLQWVREIEYDTELATGSAVAGGEILRMRSDSQTFEFVLPNDTVPRWHLMLPPRRPLEPAVAAS